MRRIQLYAVAGAALLGLFPGAARAHGKSSWSFGFSFGGPPPCYRPCFGPPVWGFRYVRPYPVYVAPAPVIVEPAPIVIRPAPVVQPAPVVSPVYQTTSAAGPVDAGSQARIDHNVQLLTHPDEKVRADAVLELGRMKAEGTVDSLSAALAGDRSPAVRETAARALGLIASPRALPALTRAAQADSDRDVRRSAQFAVEIIHSNLRGR